MVQPNKQLDRKQVSQSDGAPGQMIVLKRFLEALWKDIDSADAFQPVSTNKAPNKFLHPGI